MDFKTIVVTTDFSENANSAIPYAVELARKFGSKIHLVHVFEEPHVYSGLAEGIVIGVSNWVNEAHKATATKLDEISAALATKEKVEVTGTTLRGNPVTKVLEYADKNGAACIVIATHGRTGLSHAMHGSVAERIVRQSRWPVLSIRPQKIKPG